MKTKFIGFRPQQGLLIMNKTRVALELVNNTEFPSPTGVTYYE